MVVLSGITWDIFLFPTIEVNSRNCFPDHWPQTGFVDWKQSHRLPLI